MIRLIFMIIAFSYFTSANAGFEIKTDKMVKNKIYTLKLKATVKKKEDSSLLDKRIQGIQVGFKEPKPK